MPIWLGLVPFPVIVTTKLVVDISKKGESQKLGCLETPMVSYYFQGTPPNKKNSNNSIRSNRFGSIHLAYIISKPWRVYFQGKLFLNTWSMITWFMSPANVTSSISFSFLDWSRQQKNTRVTCASQTFQAGCYVLMHLSTPLMPPINLKGL